MCGKGRASFGAGCPTAVYPYLPVCARSLGPGEPYHAHQIPTLFPNCQTARMGICGGSACPEGPLAPETDLVGLKGGVWARIERKPAVHRPNGPRFSEIRREIPHPSGNALGVSSGISAVRHWVSMSRSDGDAQFQGATAGRGNRHQQEEDGRAGQHRKLQQCAHQPGRARLPCRPSTGGRVQELTPGRRPPHAIPGPARGSGRRPPRLGCLGLDLVCYAHFPGQKHDAMNGGGL